jgi:tol-pal system protein YbgF
MERDKRRIGAAVLLRRGLALGLLLPGLSACASVAEFRKLEYEVHRLKTRGLPAATGESGGRVADLSAEMEELRDRLARVEGRVEVAEHQSEAALQEARAARQTAAGAAPGALSPLVAPPGTEGELSASAELAGYREAYDAWRGDDHEACIDRFGEFLQTYPSSEFADDASFWMADCYYKQGDLRNAVLRFDDVVRTYPTSDKAPEALYRQGEALLRLNHNKAAETAFERVIKEYPDSARAAEARRQLELLGAG